MNVKIHPSWKQYLEGEFEKEYFKTLTDFVRSEYTSKTIYPDPKNIFAAFDHCSFDDVKVVILGQDPYHGAGQANGLCFSVSPGIKLPPSLQNIFKEIESDLEVPRPTDGDLTRWSKQGVLLLNATLTVQAGNAGSHQKKGWEEFTDAVVKAISEKKEKVVFILWGAYAQKKGSVIDESKHWIIKSPHPSPFSADRGFFGSKPFSKANDFILSYGQMPIDWR